ncbi:MAG: Gfo/Idh/MocA family protein, partial [Verrucomicrobiales bacterium]
TPSLSLQTRRNFLTTSFAGLAGLGGLNILSRVHGQGCANGAISLAMIGLGNQGPRDMMSFLNNKDIRLSAICDVQAESIARAKSTLEEYGIKNCKVYRRHEELLADPGIDAVCIATGPRWHAPISIEAMRAGKDVYCEKPVSLCRDEDVRLTRVAAETGRIFQSGTQRASHPLFALSVRMAREGKLGTPRLFYAHLGDFVEKPMRLPSEVKAEGPEPSVEVIDWDRWVGPSPKVPYAPSFLKAKNQFRGFGHPFADWGAHTMDLCMRAIGENLPLPVDFEFRDKRVVARYPDGLEILGDTPPNYPGGAGISVRLEGSEGWIYVDDNSNVQGEPKSLVQAFQNERRSTWKDIKNWKNHHQNFIDCVRSRQPAIANPELSERVMLAVDLMATAYEEKTSLHWDAENQRPVADGASKELTDFWMHREYRMPWGKEAL